MTVSIRHLKRVTDGSQTGAARQLLGNWYEPHTAGLNDEKGFQEGSYETRIYEEGEFSLVFANEAGSDSVQHLDRFGILATPAQNSDIYRPGYEYVEISDEGDLLYVGTITKANPTRTRIQIGGFDPFYMLKKAREYYAGYWNHSPRDVWDHYTQVWRIFLAEDFQDQSPFPGSASATTTTTSDGRFRFNYVAQSPVPSCVRIVPGANATVGRLYGTPGSASEFSLGLGGSQKYNYWQWRVNFTRPRFGSETVAPYGDNAYVRIGMRTGSGDLIYLQLQEKFSYMTGPDDTPGASGPATVEITNLNNDAGSYEVIVEGRERWVYFLVNQSIVGVLPMPVGSYTAQPFVSLRTGDSSNSQYVDIDNVIFRRCQPYLMRDTSLHGTYRLPGAPAAGGLWGRYYNDKQDNNLDANGNVQNYAQRVFVPTKEPYRERLDTTLNFTQANGYTTTPNSTWQPPPAGSLWWSVRWLGSIYLDLANHDYTMQFQTLQEGARLWVGKTRRGEELIDSWLVPSNAALASAATTAVVSSRYVSTPNGGMRAWIGTDPETGAYASGWYPILIEYGQRGTPGAEFNLRWKQDAGSFVTVPTSKLSPYGIIFDQYREQSHYESIRALAEMWGYQMTVEPAALESTSFPGILRPRMRVGRDTDKILTGDDLEDYGSSIDADDVADSILGDGSGLSSDDQGGQLTVEASNFDVLEGQPMVLTEQEQWGEISSLSLLQQRATSLLALRSSAWEEVSAQPAGFRELRDTFPITGSMSTLNWQAGDGIRLDLARIGVVDTTPRQILGVQRPFNPIALLAPSVSFRQRPRNMKDFMRNLQRKLISKQRNYQGQFVASTGSVGGAGAVGDSDFPSRIPLPNNLAKVADAFLVVYTLKNAGPWFIYVNGEKTTLPPVTEPGRYDVSAYVQPYYDTVTQTYSPHMKVELRTASGGST